MEEMQRFVVDTNFIKDEGLREYLSASRFNRAVIGQPQLIEIHKKHSHVDARKLLGLVCEFPAQIVILHSQATLYDMVGSTSRLIRQLTDARQTGAFPAFCDTVVRRNDGVADAHFAAMEQQAALYIEDLKATSLKMVNLFNLSADGLTDAEVLLLRRRVPYSTELQRKLIDMTFGVTGVILTGAGVDRALWPKKNTLAVNTFAFRYALFVVMYFTRWMKNGQAQIENADKLVNQIMDLQIAALASFFDGLKTREKKLIDIFEEGRSFVSQIGGYVECGRARTQK